VLDWRTTLARYAFPKLGNMAVNEITQADVFNIIEPIWISRNEQAARVLNRIQRVLDYARARGHRQGDNPAADIRESLPKASKVAPVEHHAAVPFEQIPDLMARLREVDSIPARALRFLILCASRSGEVAHADWSEIDLTKKLWTIPAGRMKADRQHRIPLSEEALALLTAPLPAKRHAGGVRADYKPEPTVPTMTGRIFEINRMDFARVLARLGIDATTHGMRSAFRQWAAERTSYSRAAIELSLAHAVALDATEDAYLRDSDLLEQRRRLMQAWCAFCCTEASAATGNVVAIRK